MLGYQVWNDEIFQWNPEDYGGLTSITATNAAIWTPEIVTVNSIYGGVDMTLDESFRYVLNAPNLIIYSPKYQAIRSKVFLPFSE